MFQKGVNISRHQKNPWKSRVSGHAADRNRTGTGITTHGILSPGRLPVPPLRHVILIIFQIKNGTYRARTCDPLLVRQMLSQLSYDPISNCYRLLTYVISKRPRRDSNSRPPPWQGGALTNWAIGPYEIFKKWTFRDSNPGPIGYEPIALTSWAKGPN